jgi:hypothetical protein
MKKYKIIRHYICGDNYVTRVNLTIDEAIEHCKDPESSSSTCKDPVKISLAQTCGPWFDSYEVYEEINHENNI